MTPSIFVSLESMCVFQEVKVRSVWCSLVLAFGVWFGEGLVAISINIYREKVSHALFPTTGDQRRVG